MTDNRRAVVCFALLGATSILLQPHSEAACNVAEGRAYGDCSDIDLQPRTKNAVTVRSYVAESGIISGAVVEPGGQLQLSGISEGDITVREGANFSLTGIVNGAVNNLGGHVEIDGIVDHLHTTGGTVSVGGSVGWVSGRGSVLYKQGAIVGGAPIEEAVERVGAE